MLSQNIFFYRVEDMRFLNIEGKIALYELFHADHKLVHESCIMWILDRWLNYKFLNIFLGYDFLWLNLLLDLFISIFELLEEGKRNQVLILEVYIRPLNVSLDIIDWFLI